jgi:hypothetical protein
MNEKRICTTRGDKQVSLIKLTCFSSPILCKLEGAGVECYDFQGIPPMDRFIPVAIEPSSGLFLIAIPNTTYTSARFDQNPIITVNAGKTAEYSTGLSTPGKTPGFGVIGAVLPIGSFLVVRKIGK